MQFLGTLFGDHAKTAIGTRLTTGSVIGAGANVFGPPMAPKVLAPFSWGASPDALPYDVDRFLGVAERVQILKGRSDIPRFLLGADLLIHPAYNENTGTVLLEALVSGLPVLVTDVCGYAHYIAEADAGRVLGSPFEQAQLNQTLAQMLADDAQRAAWGRNGLAYAETADLYSMPERAADVILKEKP